MSRKEVPRAGLAKAAVMRTGVVNVAYGLPVDRQHEGRGMVAELLLLCAVLDSLMPGG